MKIAIYAICKNEEKHVQRFLDSCNGADEIVVLDTGSEDDSVAMLRKGGASVYQETIKPWRFDVARNRSLDLVSEHIDVCICLDLDEVILPGWRAAIEAGWAPGNNRAHYWYSEGNERKFRYNKIHSRHGWRWKYIVHEELHCSTAENICWVDVDIQHWQDKKKYRGQYYPMLLQAVREEPNYARLRGYLMVELHSRGMYHQAIDQAEEIMKLKQWNIERAYTCLFAADISRSLSIVKHSSEWLFRAITSAPKWREPWYFAAKHFQNTGDHVQAVHCAMMAMELDERIDTNYSSNEPWGPELYICGGKSADAIDSLEEADMFLKTGLSLFPDSEQMAKAYADFLIKRK